MIHIEKEGLPDGIKQKIIEIRKSESWKNIDDNDVEDIRNVFDNDFPKNDVKKILIHEQKGLCAYCMKKIEIGSHSKIEHFIPLSKDKEKSIDYNNMLGVCDGGERVVGKEGHILCCDSYKKEKIITINPLNKVHMEKIAYKVDGTIYTSPKDEEIENDINETLMLNGVKKSNGVVRDTSTELLKGRRDVYERARLMLINLDKKKKCTSRNIKKLIDELQNVKELEEFVGVKLYYFKKKYDSLVKRGL